eukprot:scaffold106900_cov50-Attheya_sp.AAC.4
MSANQIPRQEGGSEGKDMDGNPAKKPRIESEVVVVPEDAKVPVKKSKFPKKKHIDPKILEMRRLVQLCCKTNDLLKAIRIYDEALANDIQIEAQTFYNLLNLCDGLADRGVHIGTPRASAPDLASKTSAKGTPEQQNKDVEDEVLSVDSATRRKHAFRIKQHMKELDLPLNETAYTALVRILSKAHDVEMAEQILAEAESVQQCRPKLRMYSSLLLAYSELENMGKVKSTWIRLKQLQIEPSEKEYCAMIVCATKVGDAQVMDRALADLAEDVLVPSRDTTRAIVAWFSSQQCVQKSMSETTVSSLQPPLSEAPSMGPVVAEQGWTIHWDCHVDGKTGTLDTGIKLKQVPMSMKDWTEMTKMNEQLVLHGQLENDTSKFQGGGKGEKRLLKQKHAQERRTRLWESFKRYLTNRVGTPACESDQNEEQNCVNSNSTEPSPIESCEKSKSEKVAETRPILPQQREKKRFDVIVDGANVGYYKQNFAGSPKHVDYRQIDWVVQHFLKRGKSVLLVLHERHFAPYLMPQWAAPIVKSWEEEQVLFRAPSGSNDDWYWLHAALWCGRGTLVVTNDEMRDHHFQMLAHRSFLRWKERHQVHFSFDTWDKSQQSRSIQLIYPDIYSRRIQRATNDAIIIPLPKRGDENRFLDGNHIADDTEPIEETYVCIRSAKSQ